MFEHFERFAKATGDARWRKLANNGVRMFEQLQRQSTTGLLPDFIVTNDSDVKPAPKQFLEGDLDGGYGYNACRVPWRLQEALSGSRDKRLLPILHTLNAALMEIANHDPMALKDGYDLSGWDVGTKTGRLAFVAPAAAGLMQDPSFVIDASNWRAAVRNMDADGQGYFNETVRMMTLLP